MVVEEYVTIDKANNHNHLKGSWVDGTDYIVGDWVNNDGVTYECIAAHTASSSDEPIADDVAVGPQGEQGIQGEKGDKGDKGDAGGALTPRGTYSALTTYYIYDMVKTAEGNAYYSLQDDNLGNVPPTDGTDDEYWACFVEKGDQGESASDAGGWIDSGETWTYASADDPTYTFTVSGDVTSKYQAGDRLKLTQTTVKYFIITKIAYSSPNTTVTVYGGTDYDLADAAITANYYSKMRVPHGFPFDVTKWSVVVSDSGNYTQSSPSIYSTTFYNLGSISVIAPIGRWNTKYRVPCYQSNTSNTIASAYTSLSTSRTAVSDSRFTDFSRITTPTGANQIFRVFLAEAILALTTKTTYYLIEGSGISGGTTLAINGGSVPITIELVSAYL